MTERTALLQSLIPNPQSPILIPNPSPMLPTIIESLMKIALIIGGLMTAAAYFVLVERWLAAWVQDRVGPNRVGIPLTKIRFSAWGSRWPTG